MHLKKIKIQTKYLMDRVGRTAYLPKEVCLKNYKDSREEETIAQDLKLPKNARDIAVGQDR